MLVGITKKIRRKPVQREATGQMAVVHFLRLHETGMGFVLHASPNSGKFPVQYLDKLIKMGMRPGWPDLEIQHHGQMYYFEFKHGHEKARPEQLVVHERLRKAGGHVWVMDVAEPIAVGQQILAILRQGTGL